MKFQSKENKVESISDYLKNEIKINEDYTDHFISHFMNFYIKNFKIIHKEMKLEDISKLSILEPFINTNKLQFFEINLFSDYIKNLDFIDDTKTLGNINHYANTSKMLEKTNLKKGFNFCIKNKIDINNHNEKEFDLFLINIKN
jgi:hypothetical protein